MNYLCIDTETSGLFDFRKPADADGQPRMCGVTMIPATDENDFEVADGYTVLIKPDGWEISPEITEINGLTTERCEAEGVPVREALDVYTSFIKEGRVVVAFNAQFDCKQIRGELRRAGMDDLFEQTKNICTMRGCKSLGIEKAGAKKGGFPKLSDAYRHFYGRDPDQQHNSLADATSCLMIFKQLVKLGVAPEAAVHYAKERPVAATANEISQ